MTWCNTASRIQHQELYRKSPFAQHVAKCININTIRLVMIITAREVRSKRREEKLLLFLWYKSPLSVSSLCVHHGANAGILIGGDPLI